jgi:Amt family ammonium transporter
VGFFAEQSWNEIADGLFFGDAAQLGRQALAVVAASLYAVTGTYVLLHLVRLVAPLRVGGRDEGMGLDVTRRGEEAYIQGDGAILFTSEAGIEVARPVPQP